MPTPAGRKSQARQGVREGADRVVQSHLERQLFTGTLGDELSVTEKRRKAPPPQETTAPKASLLDVATAYLQDRGESVADADGPEPLPEQRTFVDICKDMTESVTACRTMYAGAQSLIASKEAELKRTLAAQQHRKPVELLEHYSFEDYQDYLREIGCSTDEPNFTVDSEANLEPILRVLHDEAIAVGRGYTRVARRINGVVVIEHVYDDGGIDGFSGGYHGYKPTTKVCGTQTEFEAGDRSLAAQIARQNEEIQQLRQVCLSQEQRLVQHDIFNETVQKRMRAGVAEVQMMQRTRETELERLTTLLVDATTQNEALVNRLSALANPHDKKGRKLLAGNFTAQLRRVKGKCAMMEQQCEALERNAMGLIERRTVDLAASDARLAALHRGMLDSSIGDAMEVASDELRDLTIGGPGGATMLRTLDHLEKALPTELFKTFSALAESAFSRIDAHTALSVRSIIDAVQNGHKPLIVSGNIIKAPDLIANCRNIISEVFLTLGSATGTQFNDAEKQQQSKGRAVFEEREQELLATIERLQEEHHEALMQAKFDAAAQKKVKLAHDFKSVGVQAAGTEKPPRLAPFEGGDDLDGASTNDVLHRASSYTQELADETRELAAFYTAPAPSRVESIHNLSQMILELHKRATTAEKNAALRPAALDTSAYADDSSPAASPTRKGAKGARKGGAAASVRGRKAVASPKASRAKDGRVSPSAPRPDGGGQSPLQGDLDESQMLGSDRQSPTGRADFDDEVRLEDGDAASGVASPAFSPLSPATVTSSEAAEQQTDETEVYPPGHLDDALGEARAAGRTDGERACLTAVTSALAASIGTDITRFMHCRDPTALAGAVRADLDAAIEATQLERDAAVEQAAALRAQLDDISSAGSQVKREQDSHAARTIAALRSELVAVQDAAQAAAREAERAYAERQNLTRRVEQLQADVTRLDAAAKAAAASPPLASKGAKRAVAPSVSAAPAPRVTSTRSTQTAASPSSHLAAVCGSSSLNAPAEQAATSDAGAADSASTPQQRAPPATRSVGIMCAFPPDPVRPSRGDRVGRGLVTDLRQLAIDQRRDEPLAAGKRANGGALPSGTTGLLPPVSRSRSRGQRSRSRGAGGDFIHVQRLHGVKEPHPDDGPLSPTPLVGAEYYARGCTPPPQR